MLTSPSRSQEDADRRRPLTVAVTGAFLTGRPVKTTVGDYEELRQSLGGKLSELDGQGWLAPGCSEPRSTYFSGGGFSEEVPLVIANRQGTQLLGRLCQLIESRPADEWEWYERFGKRQWLIPTEVHVDVYDLGMAVITARLALHLPPHADLAAVAESLKKAVWLKSDGDGRLSPLSEALRLLARETVRQLRDAANHVLPQKQLPDPWLAPFLTARGTGTGLDEDRDCEWGRLLWLHPVHIVEVDESAQLEEACAALRPPFRSTIDIPDGRLIAGIGWSAVVITSALAATTYASYPRTVIAIVERHWAYIALHMEIDRGLLALLDNDRWSKSLKLAELEKDAEEVFADYTRATHARARADSALASLGPDEQAIWDVLSEVHKFEAIVAGVDRKIALLRAVSERRVQQAAAEQARRTSSILSSLTALTIVTVGVALVTYFVGSRSDRLAHLEIRVAFVVVAAVLAFALYWHAYRQRPHRPKNEPIGPKSPISRRRAKRTPNSE